MSRAKRQQLAGTERLARSARLRRLWLRLLSGYGVVLRGLGGALAIAAATAAAAVVFVFPLWYLATNAPGVYTAAVSALLAVLALTLVRRQLLRLVDAVRRGEYTGLQLLRRVRAAALVVLVIVLAYVTALLFVRGRLLVGGLAAVALLVAIGLPAGRLSGRNADPL